MTHVSLILQDRDISVSHAVTYISLTLAHQDLEALIAGHGLPSDIRTKLIQVFASGLGLGLGFRHSPQILAPSSSGYLKCTRDVCQTLHSKAKPLR